MQTHAVWRICRPRRVVIRGPIHVLTVHTYRYILGLHECWDELLDVLRMDFSSSASAPRHPWRQARYCSAQRKSRGPRSRAGLWARGFALQELRGVWIVTFRGWHLHLSTETLKIITDLTCNWTAENTVLEFHLQLYPIHTYPHWPGLVISS